MGFIVPFLFVFSGTLILRGDPVHILIDVAAALWGIWLITAAMAGYALRMMGVFRRIVCAVAGVAMLIPMGLFAGGLFVNLAGVVIGAMFLYMEISGRRRNRLEMREEMSYG